MDRRACPTNVLCFCALSALHSGNGAQLRRESEHVGPYFRAHAAHALQTAIAAGLKSRERAEQGRYESTSRGGVIRSGGGVHAWRVRGCNVEGLSRARLAIGCKPKAQGLKLHIGPNQCILDAREIQTRHKSLLRSEPRRLNYLPEPIRFAHRGWLGYSCASQNTPAEVHDRLDGFEHHHYSAKHASRHDTHALIARSCGCSCMTSVSISAIQGGIVN